MRVEVVHTLNRRQTEIEWLWWPVIECLVVRNRKGHARRSASISTATESEAPPNSRLGSSASAGGANKGQRE